MNDVKLSDSLDDGSKRSLIGPLYIIWRALLYSFTALSAFFGGAMLGGAQLTTPVVTSIFAIWSLSVPFFLSYAACFHFSLPNPRPPSEYDRTALEITWRVLAIFIALFFPLMTALRHNTVSSLPNPLILSVCALYPLICWGYGYFLWKHPHLYTPSAIRHQLLWPVVLSIAVPLYLGEAMFVESVALWPTLLPVLSLVVFVVVTDRLSNRWLLFVSVVVLIVFVVASWLGVSVLGSFAIHIVTAAYLAVFETWSATAQSYLRRGSHASDQASEEGGRLYRGASWVLAITALVLPLQHLFGGYELVYLVGLFVLSVGATILWFWAGGDNSRLAHAHWLVTKTVIGLVFLGVLVADRALPLSTSSRWVPNLVSLQFVAFLGGLALLVHGRRFFQSPIKVYREMDSPREVLPALITPLSLGLCLVPIAIGSDSDPMLRARADGVFWYYVSFAVISLGLMAVIRTQRGGGPGGAATAFGLLVSSRLHTTVFIGVISAVSLYSAVVSSLEIFLSVAMFMLAAGGGFLVNDWFDVERDAINKPWRAIPSGLLSARLALVVGSVSLGASMMIAIAIPTSWIARSVGMLAAIAAASYGLLVARVPVIKNVFSAILCALPLVYGLILRDASLWLYSLPAAGVLFLTGREAVLDLLDRRGDLATGVRTLAGRLEPSTLLALAGTLAAAGHALLFVTAVEIGTATSWRLAVGSLMLSVMLVLCLWGVPRRRWRFVLQQAWMPVVPALLLVLQV